MRFSQILVAAVIAAAASAPHAQPAPASAADHGGHHPEAAAAPQSDGEVRKLDKAQGKVTLRHGPLKNLDMPAMTMVFKAADPKLLDGLKEGDKVKFAAERVNGAFTVTAIEPAAHYRQSQTSGYAGMMDREIKALSAEQVADLREGRGMGASLPAELNGVPGPMHALQLAAQLKLTPEQRRAVEGIAADMKARAQGLGARIVAEEASLDKAFKERAIDEKGVEEAAARIASLQGQLRAVHLIAHLRTRGLLSDEQVAAYDEARGYATRSGHGHRH